MPISLRSLEAVTRKSLNKCVLHGAINHAQNRFVLYRCLPGKMTLTGTLEDRVKAVADDYHTSIIALRWRHKSAAAVTMQVVISVHNTTIRQL